MLEPSSSEESDTDVTDDPGSSCGGEVARPGVGRPLAAPIRRVFGTAGGYGFGSPVHATGVTAGVVTGAVAPISTTPVPAFSPVHDQSMQRSQNVGSSGGSAVQTSSGAGSLDSLGSTVAVGTPVAGHSTR
jgi:hypothetical protein